MKIKTIKPSVTNKNGVIEISKLGEEDFFALMDEIYSFKDFYEGLIENDKKVKKKQMQNL